MSVSQVSRAEKKKTHEYIFALVRVEKLPRMQNGVRGNAFYSSRIAPCGRSKERANPSSGVHLIDRRPFELPLDRRYYIAPTLGSSPVPRVAFTGLICTPRSAGSAVHLYSILRVYELMLANTPSLGGREEEECPRLCCTRRRTRVPLWKPHFDLLHRFPSRGELSSGF